MMDEANVFLAILWRLWLCRGIDFDLDLIVKLVNWHA